jgi:hypothetical protein
MLTDKQIKTQATKRANQSCYDDFNPPETVIAECSDGVWRRKVEWDQKGERKWFRLSPWEKIN